MILATLLLILTFSHSYSEDIINCDDYCEVIVISDLNESYGSTRYRADIQNAVNHIIDQRPDLVITTGDHVAGQKQGLNYQAMWDVFHKVVTRPITSANIPFAPAPGNHDASAYSAYHKERMTYKKQWEGDYRPKVKMLNTHGFPFRYSYSLGPALFIVLDSTTVNFSQAEQKWVEFNLEKYGDNYPVKIVYGHVPLYPFAVNREKDYMHAPDFENVLNKYDVDLFVSGHHHTYYPGRRGKLGLVGTSCLGGGTRSLIGDETGKKSPRSIIKFKYNKSGVFELNAYKSPYFQEVISRDQLPKEVGIPGKKIKIDKQFL